MNTESKINVHHSALVSLKAELLRKQAEVQQEKLKLKNEKQIINSNKISYKDKNNEQIDKESKKRKKTLPHEELDLEELNTLKKSKLMLEAKSRLYSKLSKSHTTINPNFLVDFKNKSDDDEPKEKDEEEEGICSKSDENSDDEWVEYTDCFGRTRKCLKEDLPIMKEKDNMLKIQVSKKEPDKKNLFIEDRNPTKEPEIEIMRRKWEEQSAKLSDKTDIHYQDILFDEARTHGVGYYAFSQDEQERAKQQQNLLNLRKETEKKQKEAEKIRNLKDKMEKNRLRVARIRQRVRAGLPVDDLEEEFEDTSQEEQSNSQNVVEENQIKEKEDEEDSGKETIEEIEKKIDAFGELLGKRNRWYVMSQEEWVEKKRQERDSEFAPNYYDNFKSSGFQNFSSNNKNEKGNSITDSGQNEDSNDSDVIGPMPPSNFGKEEISDHSVNIEDSVEAGLKFLRNQLEKHSSS